MILLMLITGGWLYQTDHDVHWPGFISTMVFYLLIFSLGSFASRRFSARSSEDLMLAGRKLPLGLAVFTMSATWVGGGYINGSAEFTYSSGLAWVLAPWGLSPRLIIG